MIIVEEITYRITSDDDKDEALKKIYLKGIEQGLTAIKVRFSDQDFEMHPIVESWSTVLVRLTEQERSAAAENGTMR